MKKSVIILALLGLLPCTHAVAQTFQVNRNDYDGAVYTYTSANFSVSQRVVQNDTFCVVTFDGATPSQRLGAPDLPRVSRMIEVPLCKGVRVKVTDVRTESMKPLPYRMMPVQPAPSKSDKTARPFVLDAAVYSADEFFSNELATVEMMGVARDRNIAMLRLSPLSYNPVSGEMERVTSMKVTLTYEGADVAATERMHNLHYSPDFALGQPVLSLLSSSKAVRDAAPLHYLIVSHSSFRGALDDFVAWKKRQGFLVTIAYTDDPGVGTTNTAIASYIKRYYTNATTALPAPTYLLLVGDHEQLPAFTARCTSPASDHVTDLYYATWTSGDNVPDCYYGRFSAKTVAQVTAQVEKTIYYERYDFSTPSYLGKGILVAGVDGGTSGDNGYTYADPTMDYLAKTYINAGHGYQDVRYYKNNTGFSPQGVTVTGTSNSTASASALRTLYGKGYGWINYSAHGNYNEWSDPSFTVSHVSTMGNKDKPSFMIGNCCLSGKFDVDNCFGESLLRKDQKAGAVAYIGATNSTYWPHDFCWTVGVRSNFSNTMNTTYNAQNLGMYDRLFHDHGESYTQWHNTAGSLITSGNTAVESYGSYTLYYWEIYELFGDPSLMPWNGEASVMPVTASAAIPAGTTTYTVSAPARAYVALTTRGTHELVAAAYVDPSTGNASLTLPSNLTPGGYELAIWAQHYRPYFQDVTVTVPTGPYLVINSFVPAAGTLQAGADNAIDVVVSNCGVATAWSGTLTVTSTTEGVQILTPAERLPYINPGDSAIRRGAVHVYVPANFDYRQPVTLVATLDFGTQATQTYALPVAASQLTVSRVAVSPAIAANASVTVTCSVTNTGSSATDDLTFLLINSLGLAAQEAQPMHIGVIPAGRTAGLSFTMQMASQLPGGVLPFLLRAVDTVGNVCMQDTLKLQGVGGCTEDFESGALTQYNWTQGANPWEVTGVTKHSGAYSVRSKTNLNNRRTSDMQISWTSTIDDSISFYYMVSSEADCDKFIFYIDNTSQMEASGTDAGWQYVAFPVSAGTHTFKFSYSKDWSATGGSDCVWVDDITFPYSKPPYQYQTDTVCQGDEYTFMSRAINTDQLGTFVFVDSLHTPRTWLALTVEDTPEVTIATYGIPVEGRRIVLVASGASRYEWSTGDTTATVVVELSADTVYSVRGYRGSCYSDASTNVVLGIAQAEAVQEAVLYPNPASDRITVQAAGAVRVTLMDLMGRPLQAVRSHGDAVSIEIQNLPDGVYFVKVETLDASVVKKFVKR